MPCRTRSSYDFVQDRTHDGKAFRMLTVIDGECLAIRVERKMNIQNVLHVLGKLFVRHGPPQHVRSDNGPEFVARAVREWLARFQVKTLFITPGSRLSALQGNACRARLGRTATMKASTAS